VKNVSAPSKLPPEHIGRQYPSSPFRLEWVHGFRCKDVCNNLRYNSSGKILFHAGAVSVVMDKASNTQKINSVHSNDIVAMDVFIPKDHSCTYVATGEVGMNPRIVIWDGDTSETLGVVRGFQKKAVIHLSFDETGRKLVAIGHDNSVVLYTLKPRAPRGFDIVRTFASVSPYSVLVASFVGKDRFASCGSGFVDFWSIEDRDTYRRKSGLWGKIVSSDTITLCVSAHPNQVDGEVVTGSKSGDLLVWSGRNCVKQINAHFKALNAMYVVFLLMFSLSLSLSLHTHTHTHNYLPGTLFPVWVSSLEVQMAEFNSGTFDFLSVLVFRAFAGFPMHTKYLWELEVERFWNLPIQMGTI